MIFFGTQWTCARRLQRLRVSSRWPQIARNHGGGAGAYSRAAQPLLGGAAPLRKYVLGDGVVCSGRRHSARSMWPAFAGGVRSRFLRVLRRGGAVIEFGWGAALLTFLTLQRIAELCGRDRTNAGCS